MNPSQMVSWAVAMNKMCRPFLTAFITTVYNAALLFGVIAGELNFETYITAVGPINGIVVGFWFAKREEENKKEPTP